MSYVMHRARVVRKGYEYWHASHSVGANDHENTRPLGPPTIFEADVLSTMRMVQTPSDASVSAVFLSTHGFISTPSVRPDPLSSYRYTKSVVTQPDDGDGANAERCVYM